MCYQVIYRAKLMYKYIWQFARRSRNAYTRLIQTSQMAVNAIRTKGSAQIVLNIKMYDEPLNKL